MKVKSELVISGTACQNSTLAAPLLLPQPQRGLLGGGRAFYPMGVRVCAVGRVYCSNRGGRHAKFLKFGYLTTIERTCPGEIVANGIGPIPSSFVSASTGRTAEAEQEFDP